MTEEEATPPARIPPGTDSGPLDAHHGSAVNRGLSRFLGLADLLLAAMLTSCQEGMSERARVMAGGAPVARGATSPHEELVSGPRHFVDGYPALNADGSVNVVIEIPAGTTAKFEVDMESGALRWERRNGIPRTVEFLGYPGNYGMVPSTVLPEEEGGDGDPLDVLVLGPALERGSVVRVRVIGMLGMVDEGETDDKLVAVPIESGYRSAFSEIADISELSEQYPEVRRIIELWFSAYDGPGVIQLTGWSGPAEARVLLSRARSSHETLERGGPK